MSEVAEHSFQFRGFTDLDITQTREQWEKDVADELAFPTEVSRLMSALVALDPNEPTADTSYGVFHPKSKFAIAICEIAITRHSPRSKWVKMLKLRLKPSLENALQNDEKNALSNALDVFSEAVKGLFGLKKQHNATILKIYGSSKEQKKFLTFFGIALEKNMQNTYKAKMEGNFLVVSNKDEKLT